MFDIQVCPLSFNCIVRFWLTKYNTIIGEISIYPSKVREDKGILDIFILPEYRKRWLGKSFAKEILNTVINTMQQRQIKTIHTKALRTESPRLLDFFGFEKYNGEYYFLKIS